MTDCTDHQYMSRAIRLARLGRYTTDPNPRVGCVLVRAGEIVGEGWHVRTGGPHAEAVALQMAGERAAGATAYVTLEPCSHHGRTPPCADALVGAGVKRVVIASNDPNPEVNGGGIGRLEAAGIEVLGGVMATEAGALNRGYLLRRTQGRPFVRSKLAVSLDGRTALANGDSKWITGDAARADVHELRARSSAILTGVGTILADDPALNVRREDLGDVLAPTRIVLDSKLRTPADAKLFGLSGPVLIFCADPVSGRLSGQRQALEDAGAIVETLPAGNGRISLAALMQRLAELEVNELLVEAGECLNGALMQAGLIDELVIYMAGHVMGSDARGMFGISPLADMGDRMEYRWVESRRVGNDMRLVLERSSG